MTKDFLKPLKVYWHLLKIESHRSVKRRAELVLAMEEAGLVLADRLRSDCDVALCGTFDDFESFKEEVDREDRNRRRIKIKPTLTVYYNWDLYPWQLRGDNPQWKKYARDLQLCRMILVPSEPVRVRTKEFCDRDSIVVHPSCNAFEEPVWDGGYVLQSMRDYDKDPSYGMLESCCDELGIRLLKLDGQLPQAEFHKTLAGARLIVSPYWEASTGGLAILEGYRLGKRVLISDSPYQGANEYFTEGQVETFRWNDLDHLKSRIAELYAKPNPHGDPTMREWVDANYSDAAFSQRLATALWGVVR